jgi:alpha-tubulin suppressor-like RCC1 family protein
VSPTFSSLNIVYAGCGNLATALLSENGKLYVYGEDWGEGEGRELQGPNVIVFMACGDKKICGVGSEGEFYLWEEGEVEGKRLACAERVCDCAAGERQVFALSVTGVLYVCGNGMACGQGRDDWKSEELTPVSSLKDVKIRRIFAYNKQSAAIDETGRVFVCGDNCFGRLGMGDVGEVTTFDRLTVFDDHPVIEASLGYVHAVFVTENRELYTCGSGGYFGTCNATEEVVKVPRMADLGRGKAVMTAVCGVCHTIIGESLREPPQHPGRLHFGLCAQPAEERHFEEPEPNVECEFFM